jgi:hypothetical protein
MTKSLDDKIGTRRDIDEKIFEMHGTISTLAANISAISEKLSQVPTNTVDIVQLKDKVTKLEEGLKAVSQEQKILGQASAFFKVIKWLTGLIITCAAAWVILEGVFK